jgi:four helix bundle protein
MDNIAEGFDSGTDPEFIRFLGYSQRSSSEVKSQLYRALDRKFINQDEFDSIHELADKAYRKTGALIKYLKSCRKQPPPPDARRPTPDARRTTTDD